MLPLEEAIAKPTNGNQIPYLNGAHRAIKRGKGHKTNGPHILAKQWATGKMTSIMARDAHDIRGLKKLPRASGRERSR